MSEWFSFDVLKSVSSAEWWLHGAVFTINLLLLFFSKPIIERIDPGQEHKLSVKLFVAANILFLLLHFVDIALMTVNLNYQNLFIKIAASLFVFYTAILLFNIGGAFLRKRFGDSRQFESETVYFDTYSSRIVSILFLVILSFFTIYLLIKLWNLDSLLEATGIFGIIVGFIALTSGVWAPDILSGLIILNSKVLDDGDVVVVDGYPDEYIIHKVSFIYTILYDIRNNHRTFIRNKRFIASKIDNLSRVASSDGVRKSIVYKIGYPDLSLADQSLRLQNLERFTARVDKLFKTASELALASSSISIRNDKPLEWFLTNTGDYALEYTLFIYLKAPPSTKVTSTARKYLLSSLYEVNQLMLRASAITGVELQTPDLLSLESQGGLKS